ncbi:MAG: RNA polymerase sigma factor [Verrucomicrobiota bacterium]
MDTDWALIQKFRETGDLSRLDELVERHIDRMRAVVYSMVLNHADKDDIVQEVFVRAFKGLDGFDGRSAFSTWLHRIALNTARSHLRTCNRSAVCATGEVPASPAKSADGPQAGLEGRELKQQIESAMNELSDKLRAAVVLLVVENRPVGEAAAIEECSAATMYWRVHQARRKLKTKLGDYLP